MNNNFREIFDQKVDSYMSMLAFGIVHNDLDLIRRKNSLPTFLVEINTMILLINLLACVCFSNSVQGSFVWVLPNWRPSWICERVHERSGPVAYVQNGMARIPVTRRVVGLTSNNGQFIEQHTFVIMLYCLLQWYYYIMINLFLGIPHWTSLYYTLVRFWNFSFKVAKSSTGIMYYYHYHRNWKIHYWKIYAFWMY